jgi:hypothetical protein
MFRAFAKDSLRGVSPQVASLAVFGAVAKFVGRFRLREKLKVRARSQLFWRRGLDAHEAGQDRTRIDSP